MRVSLKTNARNPQHAGELETAQRFSSNEAYTAKEDRRALTLLVSLLLFFVVSPLAAETRMGEILFLLTLYGTLIAAAMVPSAEVPLRFLWAMMAACSLALALASLYHPSRLILITNWCLVATFFGYISSVLFVRLDRRGRISPGRLYMSVSLYLLLGVFYAAVFNLLDVIRPGSLIEQVGPRGSGGVTRYGHLYFSLATLTTLGYGDIIPSTPFARMIAALEAVTGVLYVAITVARLVAAHEGPASKQD